MTQTEKKLVEKLATETAQKFLDIDTLQVQNLDRLDFHDVGVASLKAALIHMYQLGQASKN